MTKREERNGYRRKRFSAIQIAFLLYFLQSYTVNADINKKNDKISCLVRIDQYQYSLYLLDERGGIQIKEKNLDMNINFCNSLPNKLTCDQDKGIREYAKIKTNDDCNYLYISRYEYLNDQDPEKGIQVHLEGKSNIKVLIKLKCDIKNELKNVKMEKNNDNIYEISASTIYSCPSIDISYPWSYFEDHSRSVSFMFFLFGLSLIFEAKEMDIFVKISLSIIIGLVITTIIYQQNYVGDSWMSSIEVFRFSLGLGLCLCAFVFSFKDLSHFINGAFVGYLIHLSIFNLTFNNRDKYFYAFYQLEVWIVTIFGVLNIFFQEPMTIITYQFYSAVMLQICVNLISSDYQYMNLFKGGKELEKDSNQVLYIVNTFFIFFVGVIVQKFIRKN